MARRSNPDQEVATVPDDDVTVLYDPDGLEYRTRSLTAVTRLVHAHGYTREPRTGAPDPATAGGGGLERHDLAVETAAEQAAEQATEQGQE